MMLRRELFDQHTSKRYIYFAMAFSVFVEMLNLRIRRMPGWRRAALDCTGGMASGPT
jgi:predicted tellurium resistance membrane protein TerC